MNHRFIALFLAGFLGIGLSACSEQQNEDLRAKADAAKVDLQVSDLRKSVSSGLDQANVEISELSERVRDSGEDVSQSWKVTLASLRKEQGDIAKDLDELQYGTADAFDDSREDFHDRVSSLESEITEARLATIESKADFQVAVESEMKRIDSQIKSANGRLENASVDTKNKYRDTLDDLRDQRNELQKSWDRLGSATDDQFSGLKNDIAAAIAALDRESSKALRRLDHMNEV